MPEQDKEKKHLEKISTGTCQAPGTKRLTDKVDCRSDFLLFSLESYLSPFY